MKARLAAGLAMLVVGVVLPIVALATSGKPWGFRGHPAVLLEASGTVELQAGERRMKADGLTEPNMKATAGMFLEHGDEVRVGRLAEARVRLPGGTVALGDGARVAITEKGVKLAAGAVEIEIARGTTPFIVELAAPAAELRLRPAAESGLVRVVADGKGQVRAHVVRGSAEAAAAAGALSAETGKVLAIGNDGKPTTLEPPPTLTIKSVCDTKTLSVEAPPVTQVFALRQLSYPDKETGKVSIVVPPGTSSVPVFAKDVVGNLARVTPVRCEEAVAAPPTPGKLKGPPKGAPPKPGAPAPAPPKSGAPAPKK